MNLLGFNFTKISIEKFSDRPKELKISTNIDISEIKEAKADILKTKDSIVAVKFIFTVNYEQEIAKIELAGNILLSLEQKMAKEVLKNWKDKKMPDDFRMALFNLILRKSSIKALELEEEMNLPVHIPIPSIRKENYESKNEK